MGCDGRVVKGRGDANAAGWSHPFSSFPRNRLPPCVGKRSLFPSQDVSLAQPDTHSRCERRFRGAR